MSKKYVVAVVVAVVAVVAGSDYANARGGAPGQITDLRENCARQARAKFCGGESVTCPERSPAARQAQAAISECVSRGGK